VTKIATGPFIPMGTTHCVYGKEMEKAKPPASMWQNNLSSETLPLMAADLKLNVVPGCIESVFVTVNDGFAGMPRSHPEMKPPAMART